MTDGKITASKFNTDATHPLQAYEWGEFREKTGIRVIRQQFGKGAHISSIQMTLHPIPYTPFTIGYIPKCTLPTSEILTWLTDIGRQRRCIFIQLEPNIVSSEGNADMKRQMSRFTLRPSAHPLFTRYTFQLDISQSEEDLLKAMHPKTRYNIRVAQKYGVTVTQDHSAEAFEEYLKLTHETTQRQGFYAHTERYHRLMWETLQSEFPQSNKLTAHLLTAKLTSSHQSSTEPVEVLVSWILFAFHNALYYPYGASSSQHREAMASNLMMWEAIRFGKKHNLKTFDLWGALGQNPDPQDPWYGFHRFKKGYGPKLVELVGSFDLVINPALYTLYMRADKIRWMLLKIKRIM